MEIQKSEAVVYVDGYGREHDAVVTAVNPMNAGFVSLVYVDVNAPEAENVKKLADIPHVSNRSKQEANPDLPSYDVNCWKEQWEEHRALPADHPGFDHPFLQPKFDEAGARVPVERPQTAAEIEEHQKHAADMVGMLTGAGQTAPPPQPQPRVSDGYDLYRVGSFLATRNIHFKDRAACAKFVDELKPHEMRGFTEDFGVWEKANPAPRRATPDVEKADAVPVQYQSPDYAALRKQLNDYTSIFYGPHACDCPAFSGNRAVIRRAVEQGGEMYSERDPNLGLPRYEQHTCVKPGAPQPQTSAEPGADGSSATGDPSAHQSPEQQAAAENKAEDTKAPPAEEGQSE